VHDPDTAERPDDAQKDPEVQAAQEVDPVEDWYVPAEQLVQLAAEDAAE